MPLSAQHSARALWRGAALASALAAGLLLSGCPFELSRGYSCGDGWWDPDFEDCDPNDPSSPHLNGCRALGLGFDVDGGHCDPQTCTIYASEAECNTCGDGIAAAGEQCDGDDLRGQSCVGGSLGCTPLCTLDYDSCPAYCGDGRINGDEECEPGAVCGSDDDCTPDRACYQGSCVPIGGDFLPNLSCASYPSTAVNIDNKPYASGIISACVKDGCYFGRNDCSFCGDGVLDGGYTDLIAPSGTADIDPEICDGEAVQHAELVSHCANLCVTGAFNDDVVALCDFECAENCRGFAGPSDVVPGQDPEDFGCCLDKGSPCPNFDIEGVPNYPCCSWFDNPAWMAEKKCVLKDSGGPPPYAYVCP